MLKIGISVEKVLCFFRLMIKCKKRELGEKMVKLIGKILIISIIYILSTCLSVTLANTNSVLENHWADNVIDEFIKKSYIVQSKDNFKPDEDITKGELAMISNRYFAYGDLDLLEDNLVLAQKKGYLSNAKVGESVTREEVAILICKILSLQVLEGESTNFIDDSEISIWARDYVRTLEQEDILIGYPDNSFKPKKNVTKAEFVTILNRCIGIGGSDLELIDREINNIEIGIIEYIDGEVTINKIDNEIVIKSGDNISLAIAIPEDVQDEVVEYDIEDTTIIEYDEDYSVLNALNVGKTTIEFKILDGKYNKNITVIVN